MHVAHISDAGKMEPIKDHLELVANKAAKFAKSFASADCAHLVGILHDVGKYSAGFQKYILDNGPRVDHSSVGASLIANVGLDAKIGYPLAYCIAGHHGGLPNGGSSADCEEEPTLNARIRRKRSACDSVFPLFAEDGLELRAPEIPDLLYQGSKDSFSVAFWTRMLFSCLVDADFLATEEFMNGCERERAGSHSLQDLCMALEEGLLVLRRDHLQIAGRNNIDVADIGVANLGSKNSCLHLVNQRPLGRRIIVVNPHKILSKIRIHHVF